MSGPLVELKGVTVVYDGLVALREVSLSVGRGEYVAILGPNGAGKSTLIKVILGLIHPSSGEVSLFGRPPWELGFHERRRIGYVPQISELDPSLPITVYQLVLMGRYAHLGLFRRPKAQDHKAARRALELTGIVELAERRLGGLSGGERQRALIARALASEPELLILDEPTTSLDLPMTEGLYQLIDQLREELKLTVILVSHDVGVITRRIDNIACLAGRLVAHGRPQEVLTEETLECMYGKEAVLFGHGPAPHLLVSEHTEEAEGE
jgi:ABC-type Mn2+/Zn2+ transport system ATPase subunit